MWKGAVVSIHIAATGGEAMQSVPEVRAVAGRGLEGDRYLLATGTYSKKPDPGREITLIESEALEALERDYETKLSLGASRRNIVTRGTPLNHLVGREFQVGAVRLRGIRLCEPCEHLARLNGTDALPKGLVHRGGLRAQILASGAIRVGDTIES